MTGTWTVTVQLHHHKRHQLYYDVTLPPNAAALICENLEWSTLVSITPKVQVSYPHITPKQVHSAWTLPSFCLQLVPLMQTPSTGCSACTPHIFPSSEMELDTAILETSKSGTT